jgi:ABC-type phosphate/phosphonate transport system substrate-binding protein
LVALTFALAAIPERQVHAEDGVPIKIALPNSLFRDFPKVTVSALMPTFNKLMEKQTGVRGQIVMLNGADEVGQELSDRKVQLAVFHGYEFAWAQAKHPNLKPLVVAIKQNSKLTAQVVVASDTKIDKLDDLRGQPVAIPRGTPEHCRLFLSRRTRAIGQRQEKFFGKFTTPAHVAAALDDVASGKVKATVVDSVAWENYQWMNPGRARKLRSLLKSENFPTGVIAYSDGGMPPADLQKFKEGLTSAHKRPEGLQLMMLWKMNRFESVPPDYQQTLADIAKAYPPPINGDEP